MLYLWLSVVNVSEKVMAPHSSTGKSRGQRNLVGCSPWGREESDTTERLHFHFSCIGEGNGNPLQCSCLESPRDGGAWWAAIYGVAQSQTRLKRLGSSSECMAHGRHSVSIERNRRLPGIAVTIQVYCVCVYLFHFLKLKKKFWPCCEACGILVP